MTLTDQTPLAWEVSASPGERLIRLDATVLSEDALFRLIALLHRKNVSVSGLLLLPEEHPGHGHRLWPIARPGNAPAEHVIGLIRAVIGVTGVCMDGLAADGAVQPVNSAPPLRPMGPVRDRTERKDHLMSRKSPSPLRDAPARGGGMVAEVRGKC